MSLPSPLPRREQKKGLFKRPPSAFFFFLRSLFSNWYLCLPVPLEPETLGAGAPQMQEPGNGFSGLSCAHRSRLMASRMRQAACGVSLLAKRLALWDQTCQTLGRQGREGQRACFTPEEPFRLCWVTLRADPCSWGSWGVDVPTEWDHQLTSSPGCYWDCLPRVWRSEENVKAKATPRERKKRDPFFGGGVGEKV